MRKFLLSILACFWLVACAGVNNETTVPDPPDAQLYQVLGTSSLPAVMEAYDMNMHAMLRAKGYRVTEETVKVRVLRPLNDVAQSYDQAAIDNGWSIDDPLPARICTFINLFNIMANASICFPESGQETVPCPLRAVRCGGIIRSNPTIHQ